jgi:phosphoribosylpyrophosphate synthetase
MARFFGMPGNADLAQALAAHTASKAASVETRRFPDGESYVRIHGAADEHTRSATGSKLLSAHSAWRLSE